jgi:uncharacterized protein YbjT (DUF2867 family)
VTAPVLVTGATGNVGRAVVTALQHAGIPVRAATRSPARLPDGLGVEVVRLDFDDPATFDDALSGAAGLFLIRPPATVRVARTVNAFLDAAAAAGIGHVVFSSVADADANRLIPHHRIERHLRDSPVAWTILRPGFFAQNLGDAYRHDIACDDRLYVTAGDAPVAFLDVRDVGDVVAAIMRDPSRHRGRAYPLTGPYSVTFAELAARLSRQLGRAIRYEPATAVGYVRHLRSRSLPAVQVAVQLVLHLRLRRGDAATVDPTLRALLGHPGRTIEDYIADHEHHWRTDQRRTATKQGSPMSPPIERVHPPAALMRIVNPVMRTLLSSPLHGLVSRQLLVLHYTGHRTGRRYDVPVGYRTVDGHLEILTNSGWRANFGGGRDITVTYRGRRRAAHATTIDDPTVVARTYHGLISELGITRAQRRLGIRINLDRPPTLDELTTAIGSLGMAIVTIRRTADAPVND